MKKLILLFCVAGAVLFTSCSKDDDNSAPPSVLLKKSIRTYQSGANMITYTSDFTYNGNKLVNIIGIEGNDREEGRYTYTGDLITKIEWLRGGVVRDTQIYEYNASNQLVKVTSTEARDASVYRSVYVHNNGTVSFTIYKGSATDQGQSSSTGTIYFTNGDISRLERTSTGSSMITYRFSYDDKNNPFKNITGLDKIALAGGDEPGVVRNMIQRIVEVQGSPENNSTTTVQHTYNADNYPVTSSESRLRNGTTTNRGTTQYFY